MDSVPLNDMEALLKFWEDKYTPAELVEHLDISMEDLLYILTDYIEENLDKYREDIETIYGYSQKEN